MANTTKRDHLAVRPLMAKLIKEEVVARNDNAELGEQAATVRSVTEEAIAFWYGNSDRIKQPRRD